MEEAPVLRRLTWVPVEASAAQATDGSTGSAAHLCMTWGSWQLSEHCMHGPGNRPVLRDDKDQRVSAKAATESKESGCIDADLWKT